MKVAFIGLGKMGTRMVEKLLRDGHHVSVWNRSKDVVEQFHALMQEQKLDSHLSISYSIPSLVETFAAPRVMWLMLPAGEVTDLILSEVSALSDPEDILIDGGNAYYKDTERRFQQLQQKRIRFLGIGVSGGIHALDNGYPLMVGGDKSAYGTITPLLDSLAKPRGGHQYFGEGGAGHFVKMVHNGIEYGMMQAIGEGFGVLEKAPYDFNLFDVATLWQKGTIVSGFLMDRAKDALAKENNLVDIDGVIAASGEGEWTVQQAKEEGVPIENIEQSLEFRKRSQKDAIIQNSFPAKMVASLRREFGGHEIKKRK